MLKVLRTFAKDESGATLAEYALLTALIAVVCITILTQLGTSIEDKFGEVDAALQ